MLKAPAKHPINQCDEDCRRIRMRTKQSTVVFTRGTPAAGHPARRGSDPVIADVRPTPERRQVDNPVKRSAPQFTAVEAGSALRPIASLIRKSEKVQQKLVPGSWQYAMLRDNLNALHVAFELMGNGAHAKSGFANGELRAALIAIASMIRKTEKAQTIVSLGTSQRALLRNRLKSLRIAAEVVEGQMNER